MVNFPKRREKLGEKKNSQVHPTSAIGDGGLDLLKILVKDHNVVKVNSFVFVKIEG